MSYRFAITMLIAIIIAIIMSGCGECGQPIQVVACPRKGSDMQDFIEQGVKKSKEEIIKDIRYCANFYYANVEELDFPDENGNYLYILDKKGILRNPNELNVKRNMHIICLSYLGGYDYYQKAAESIKIDYKKEMEKLLNENH